jgi:hypothetical protein
MKVKNLCMVALSALSLTIMVGSCKDENVETIGICPVVVSTSPDNGDTGVGLDKIITITFNGPINPATITPEAFTFVDSDGIAARTSTVSGTLSYDASNYTVSYTPRSKLKINTTYRATVETAIKDLMGNALQVDYVWTFSTGATLLPTVISTDPDNNTTNVFLNKRIEATFSSPMSSSSLTATTFTVKQGTTLLAGAVSYSNNTASFKPTNAFLPNTTYTGTITTGAKDIPGNALAKDYVWTFTTGTVTAPKVNTTDPENLATGVALNKVISATFSEAMSSSTVISSFTVMLGTSLVSGSVNYTGTTATFTPTDNLLSGNTYTGKITTGAKNAGNTPLANDYVWQFTTTGPLGPVGVDLKSVERFGIIAGVGVANNAGFSEIHDMDVGISPGVRSSITGFPPAIIVNGAIYASNDIVPLGIADMLIKAKQDLTNAYLFAEGATFPAPTTVSGDLGGLVLPPGIYKTTSTLLIQSGNLKLDGQGDVNAVWIFQIASGFTTVGGAGGSVILQGGAQAKNVFWQTGSSATIGDNTSFKGNILALTSITMNSGATAQGRMLARNGSVVMTNANTIDKP